MASPGLDRRIRKPESEPGEMDLLDAARLWQHNIAGWRATKPVCAGCWVC